VRPLLPTTDGNDEPEAMITCSSRDKHRGAEHRYLAKTANRRSRQAIFDWVPRLHGEGKTVSDIVRQTGFDRRTIAKWIRLDALPDRNASALKTSSPRYFEEYLSRRWAEGCVRGRQLFRKVKARGYTGSFSNLERLLAKWRCPTRHLARPAPAVAAVRTTDPATGRLISPIVAAALCVKPRGLLSETAKVDALKTSQRCVSWPCGFEAFFEASVLRSLACGSKMRISPASTRCSGSPAFYAGILTP
jgi:hypothetical protein